MTRPMVLRSVAWYGDGFGSWEFVGVPPARYEKDRYRVTGTLRYSPGSPPDLELVKVTDTKAGAEVAVRGDTSILTAPTDSSAEYIQGLWHEARDLAGLAAKAGRPSEKAKRVANYRRAVLELRDDWGRQPSIPQVLDYLGGGDEKQVRRDIGMKWRDWLYTIE